MSFWQRMGKVFVISGLLLLATACASSAALEETQAKLDALEQQVETLAQDLNSAQSDAATLKDSLGSTQSNVQELNDGFATTQGDVAALKDGVAATNSSVTALENDLSTTSADLSATSGSLKELKASFVTHQGEVDLLHATQERATQLLVVHDLANIAYSVNNRAVFDVLATVVADAIETTGDDDLADAWTPIPLAWNSFLDSPAGSPEEATLAQAFLDRSDTFFVLLQQRLAELTR